MDSLLIVYIKIWTVFDIDPTVFDIDSTVFEIDSIYPSKNDLSATKQFTKFEWLSMLRKFSLVPRKIFTFSLGNNKLYYVLFY